MIPSSADHSSSSDINIHSARLLIDWLLSGCLHDISSSSITGSISISLQLPDKVSNLGKEGICGCGTGLITCSCAFCSCFSGEGCFRFCGFSDGVKSKNKHTTAQSSTFEVGYLKRQDRTAESTRALAAVLRDRADATISTASLFDKASQIYNCNMHKMINPIKLFLRIYCHASFCQFVLSMLVNFSLSFHQHFLV